MKATGETVLPCVRLDAEHGHGLRLAAGAPARRLGALRCRLRGAGLGRRRRRGLFRLPRILIGAPLPVRWIELVREYLEGGLCQEGSKSVFQSISDEISRALARGVHKIVSRPMSFLREH